MERMKTRNMNPAKVFYDEGEGSGEHGGKGIDDRQWVRNARKTVQWTVFSGERAAAPEEISSNPFSTDRKRAPQCGVATISVAARRGIPPPLYGSCYPNQRFGQFLNFDSPGHCKSMLPGFFVFGEISGFFRKATYRVAAGR